MRLKVGPRVSISPSGSLVQCPSMNIDNTEHLEALKLTQPPKPEKASGGEGASKDRIEVADGED